MVLHEAMRKFAFNLFAAIALVVSFYVVFYYFPVQYVYLIDEDGWTEYATFVFYLISASLIFLLMRRYPSYRKPGYFLFVFLCLAVGFEEISWGQRILGVATPYRFSKVNLQQEINVHNIEIVQSRLRYFYYCFYVWVFAVPFVCKLWKRIDQVRITFGAPLVPFYLWPYFLAVVYFDEAPVIFHRQEPFEFLMAFSIMLFSFALLKREELSAGRKRNMRYMACGVMVFVSIMTSVLVFCFPWPLHLRWRFEQFSHLYQERNLDDQAEKLFIHLYNRPHLQGKATLRDYAVFLLKGDREEEALRVLNNDPQQLEELKIMQMKEFEK